MKIRNQLSSILDIWTMEWCIFINGQDFILRLDVVLNGIFESIMIVFNWGCEMNIFFLNSYFLTFFEYYAVSSINFVLEVTEWK